MTTERSGPGVYDPIESPEADRWFPSNDPTALLVAAVLACKDIVRIGGMLSGPRPTADRRGMTLLSVPILSLVENIVRLHKLLGRLDRSSWPPEDQDKFTQHAKKLRTHAQSGLRTLRSSRAAHHDADKLGSKGAPAATPELVLPPLADALMVLTLAFNHEGTFQWTRYPDPAKPNEVELFIKIATKARLDDEGRLTELLGFTITDDPRREAFAAVEEALGVYNRLILDAGYPARRIAFHQR